MKTAIRCAAVVTNTPSGIIRDPLVLFGKDRILHVGRFDAAILASHEPVRLLHRPVSVLIPGLIQPHIHLCQTLFRGLAENRPLLDWLRDRIFPLEAAHDPDSMYLSAVLGLRELISGGTTTIMDMGSVRHYESVLQAILESGIRALAGKALMDRNDLYPALQELTQDALQSAADQLSVWHGRDQGRIRYAMTPRYILSCSDALLKESFSMCERVPDSFWHTHAAEQQEESVAVRAAVGEDAIPHFAKLGVLSARSGLAHGIWLSDTDLRLLRETGTRLFHCPSSNLKLGSGIAPLARLKSEQLVTGLAADGATCNNRLDGFREMNLAASLQNLKEGPGVVSAKSIFEMATLGGAESLNLHDLTGSVETGKAVDLVLVSASHPGRLAPPVTDEEWYAYLVHEASSDLVTDVWANGTQLKQDGLLTGENWVDQPTYQHSLARLLSRAGL